MANPRILKGRLGLILVIGMAIALVGLGLVRRSRIKDRAAICGRWTELSAAVAAQDTVAMLALVAPARREGFGYGLRDFVSPLGPSPTILIFGDFATIWPDPDSYLYQVIPIGHSFDMVRVDGVWFFTGEFQIN